MEERRHQRLPAINGLVERRSLTPLMSPTHFAMEIGQYAGAWAR
jgi:hypothetical protein